MNSPVFICNECGKEYTLKDEEMQFYMQNERLHKPYRCPTCREEYLLRKVHKASILRIIVFSIVSVISVLSIVIQIKSHIKGFNWGLFFGFLITSFFLWGIYLAANNDYKLKKNAIAFVKGNIIALVDRSASDSGPRPEWVIKYTVDKTDYTIYTSRIDGLDNSATDYDNSYKYIENQVIVHYIPDNPQTAWIEYPWESYEHL